MISLDLQNFRCYQEKTFTFNNFGNVLIAGKSGEGKSTILLAILFALYNTGGKEIETYSEKKTKKVKVKVTFIFNEHFKIVRERNSSHLVFNDVYENDVAQQMIDEIFGRHFHVIGYIPQDSKDSFLKKSAPEKRDFLESLKFGQEHLSEKKEHVENLIKEYKQKMDKTSTKLETTKSFLMEEPEEVKFPLGKKKDIPAAIEKENMRFRNAKNTIANAKGRVAKLQKRLSDLQIANTFISSKDENITQICSLLENLSLEMGIYNEDYIGDEKIEFFQQKLQKIRNNSQLYGLISQRDADEKKINTMRETEIMELMSASEKIEKELWSTYTKEEALELIQSNEDVLKDLTKIKMLRDKKIVPKDVKSLENQKIEVTTRLENLKIELQRLDVLICPDCNAEVLLQNGSLIKCDVKEAEKANTGIKNKALLSKQIQACGNELKQIDYEILQQQEFVKKNVALDVEIDTIISQYEDDELPNENELRDDVNEMQSYYKSQISLERKLGELKDKIKKEEFSPSYKASVKELGKLTCQIQKLKTVVGEEGEDEKEEENDDEDHLRDMIHENQQKKSKIQHLKKQFNSQQEIKVKLVAQVEDYKANFLQKYSSMDDESDIIAEIEKSKIEIKEAEVKQEEHRVNLEIIDAYLKYKKDYQVYVDHLAKIHLLEEEFRIDSQYYSQTKILKLDLIEAELIALTNTIDEINSFANVYLQEFFDYPIFANLSCFKEDKKKNEKAQINLDIKYKDMDCTLSSLSGGEYARVNLAFTLSLAQMFKTPILLLDETMASLDEETADIVFKSIRRHFKHIPVISILHQVTSEGYFDQVIKL